MPNAERPDPTPKAVNCPDPIDCNVGRCLRSLRISRGIDSLTLDLLLGLPAGSIDRFEAGQRPIGASILVRIGKVFGVSPDFFFENPAGRTCDADPTRLAIDLKEANEARRFIAAYGHLSNADVRGKVLALVRAVASAAAPEAPNGSTPTNQTNEDGTGNGCRR